MFSANCLSLEHTPEQNASASIPGNSLTVFWLSFELITV